MSCLQRNLYSFAPEGRLPAASESCAVCAWAVGDKRSESANSNFFIVHSVVVSDAKVCRTEGLNGLFGVGIADSAVDCADTAKRFPTCYRVFLRTEHSVPLTLRSNAAPYPLQILHLQTICKGYLQACNILFDSEMNLKSLQMADKMREKTLCTRAKERGRMGLFFILAHGFSGRNKLDVSYFIVLL